MPTFQRRLLTPVDANDVPAWFWGLCPAPRSQGKKQWQWGRRRFALDKGVLRNLRDVAGGQKQTETVFGFKWNRRDTFESPRSLARMKRWLVARYGDVCRSGWWRDHGPQPVVLDAGCGAGMSALELFRPALPSLRYVGADVSVAVDVARKRFLEAGAAGVFIQTDLADLPLKPGSVDIVFSEGVLHHTPSTEKAFKALVPLLKPGGRILFYVYREKGPVREFTDDFIRDRLQGLSPREAWKAVEPLTELGIQLGRLKANVRLRRSVDILGIPAGRIDVQRLFYWHVAKAYYDPALTFDEMNHINFDWYAPRFAHRHRVEEVRRWCADAGLRVERERVELSGITLVARRPRASKEAR